jgi:ribosomal protein S18 acetylase RimI-like enzyme
MQFTLIEGLPSAENYNRLRAAVGWKVQDLAVVAAALPNSLYGVCAYAQEGLVGMARVIGDGGLVFYIQDVVVLPEYQGLGIGSRMMEAVMTYIRAHANRHSIIGLMAALGKEAFYTRYGFTVRPTEKLGSGMTLFWKLDR